MGIPKFGRAAQVALVSLRDRPRLRTPDSIATGPVPAVPMDPDDIARGLDELKLHGLAVEEQKGWRLTAFGHSRAEDVVPPAPEAESNGSAVG